MQSSSTVGDSSSTQPPMQNRGNLGEQRRTAERLKRRGNLEDWSQSNVEGFEIGGNLEIGSLAAAREEASGQPGGLTMAQPDGARPEVTRGPISRCRKIQASGQLGKWVVGDTERPGFGATWKSASRHRRRMRASRRLETPPPAKPEIRGEGQPEARIRGVAGGLESRGDPEFQNARRRGNM